MAEKNTFEKRKKLIYDFICDEFYVPMKFKEIAVLLQVPKEAREELKTVMEALEQEGLIHLTQTGKYIKGGAGKLTGTYQGSQKGFGFVITDTDGDDLFIPEDGQNGAFHGDRVEVVLTKRAQEGKRQEGKIIKVLEHGIVKLVGYFQRNKNFGFVVPDNQKIDTDIFIPLERSKGAVTGHKVVVELTSYGKAGKSPEGKVVEILGHVNDPGTDILSIVRDYDLPEEFGEKVLNQAERVASPVSEADMEGRMDLRDWETVTIDGEDAKDLDDAITLTEEAGGYLLGVHIADVTNYVQENSALDREALRRGTSVYLADRVIPMLPHMLSNGICSLNAGEDRLALTCLMWIDDKGTVTKHQITESVVRVNERMSYTDVKNILAGEETVWERYSLLIPLFERMEKLSGILREKRKQRGSIDFDFPESKVILDEQGKPVEIRPYDRNVATKIIEDFMLAANETVAENFFWLEVPFVYRTHDVPDEEKIKKFATFINNFGHSLHLSNKEIHPKEIQKLLARISDTPEEDLISRLALRSMKRARYTPENSGHFGLAATYYCHFTSPIRRYPDLQIHRIIKESLRGKMSGERMSHYENILTEICRQCSELERRADEAERETIKLKKAEFMQAHRDEVFEGVISGMTKWGMYIELLNTVEGLVHVTNMPDDHYDYIEDRCEMVGEHTRKTYRLGQKVNVTVTGIDEIARTIDFRLVEEKLNGKDGRQADSEQ